MKKKILFSLMFGASLAMTAQTTIDFDTPGNWGSSSGYAIHSYTEGLFSATGGDGLRESAGTQDGFAKTNGTYSWRLRNNSSVEWTATISTGGVSSFSLDARRWDGSPSPDFAIDYSTDGGTVWMAVDTINNNTLNNTSDWTTFSGVINSANPNVKVRLKANGNTERIMIDDFTWSPMSGGAVVDTTATITSIDTSVLENIGTVDVNVTLNQIPVLDKTIDLALTSGNSAVIGGFTTQAITFTGGGSLTQTVTLNITPGQLTTTSEIFDFELTNPSSDLEIGVDTTFQLTVNQMPVNPATCSDLYFSEYVEGSGYNKALEIYNPTALSIDLSNYIVERYDNGGATATGSLTLNGSLAAGGVYVIASNNVTTDAAITSVADTLTSFCSHNGDDAYILVHSGAQIDIIGTTTGTDPGSSWSVGSGSTKDKTLVRSLTVANGELTWLGVGDTQWDVYPKNSLTFLGAHTSTSCQMQTALQTVVATDTDTICEGGTIQFTTATTGGTAPYSYSWSFGDGGSAMNMNESHTYSTEGTYTISLVVTDDASASVDTTFYIVVETCATPALEQTSTIDLDTLCLGGAIQFGTTATGGTSPYTYAWAFGDGNTASTMSGTHTYAAAADYSVTLTITDDANATVDTTILVVVETCATPALEQTSTIDLDTVCLGGAIQFSTTATGGTSPYTYAWAFGDGNTASTMSGTHTYAAAADYSVTLTITDDANATVDTTINVVVGDCSSINENKGENVSMFPNPTSNGFVTLANIGNNSTVIVYNVIGEVVLSVIANDNDVLNVTNLVKGNYFISIANDNNVITKKLIIK